MKTTLDHLPAHKQQELKAIVTEISQVNDVQMVILFGSYATGKWVEDTSIEQGTIYEYRSDYDLLIVMTHEDYVKQFKIEDTLRQRLIEPGLVITPVSTIYHGIKHLNQALTYGNYFFSDITKEGILLYDSGKYHLATPKKLTPAEQTQKAQAYFDQWLNSANEFYWTFTQLFQKGSYPIAAFQLHQATERYYTAMLLVFTDYRPKDHNIERLGLKAEMLDKRFTQVFPKATDEEERLFELLKNAYIDARYKMEKYAITREELEYLRQRVELLRDVTEMSCREKIASFETGNTT